MPTARPRAKAKRPRRHTIVEQLTLRLWADESWQEFFSASEQRVMVRTAKLYWRLQLTAGFTADEMYARMVRMLRAAGDDSSGE